MVKIIMGLKGSGKTKQLIELVHTAVKEEPAALYALRKGKNSYTISLIRRVLFQHPNTAFTATIF
jgi:hypothetical protein